MKCYAAVFVVTLACIFQVHTAARILALVPYKADSHFAVFDVLFTGLVSRGHQLVVVSHFPRKTPMQNYTDINIDGSMPGLANKVDFELDSARLIFPPMRMFSDTTEKCDLVFKHSSVQEFLKYENEFDAIIMEIFGSDCFLGFVHKFNVPYIGVITSVAYPWAYHRVGNPDNPAYVPNYFLPYTDKMTFFERLINSIYYIATNIGHYLFAEIPSYKILTRYFDQKLPPLGDLARNVSLLLVNSHFSLNFPAPNVPALVEIGGIHIKKAHKLPKIFQDFLDESEHGVIYFSMGSMVRAETLTSVKLRAFIDAFSELPQRVLWKIRLSNKTVLPRNIRTYDWMPQRDILEHPKVRVFITHGGMLGTQEAVHCGVPMLGIPLFSDQRLNINNYVAKGIAIMVDYDSITKQNIFDSLQKLINDPKYWNNAQVISGLFRDRPQTPLESAMFWIEYVIRHRGAPHLRSAAVELPFYQYLLLDVLAVIILLTLFIILTLYFVSVQLISKIYKKKTNP